jgi:glutamyl-tRNA reductase
MQRLLLLGLNHATAPLEVREKLAFAPEQRAAALALLRERYDGVEAVLLCTCNRVELYAARAVHGRPRHEEMARFLAELRHIPPEQIRPHVYEKSERAVIEHVFSVASSLDSMVIGETQILGQVREAYAAARDAGAVGAALNPLFQRAVAVGKHVMHETKIAEGRLSVGSVAVECAGRIFEHYNDKTVLCMGAGKMTTLVLQAFSALKPKRMLICNRDGAKAAALAQRFGAQAVPFETLDDHLVAADVVIASTSSPTPIITRSRFETLLKLRRYRPAFLIDIALPRDIEAGVGQLENVYLYNIDDLQQVVATTRSKRTQAVDAAKTLVTAEVEKYLSWHRAREMGPMIERLYQRHYALAREEVERLAGKSGSPAEREHLEELARRIVNKMLHDPVRTLREAEGHPPGVGYLHAMEKLFHLEEPVEDAVEEPGREDLLERPGEPTPPPDEQTED